MNFSARRINALASRLGAGRYLEIGVRSGTTFLDVDMPERVGVDPGFVFDTAAHANDATRFHAMTSDRYFSEFSQDGDFGIVFIDGLHVFAQVVRDLTNTLAHTTRQSAILIDDTLPYDVYSAHPEQGEAHRLRHQAGDESNAWHGDVFKIVFLIHDFFPFLDYRTINENGNPQTLVWYGQGSARKPIYDDLEAISRMTWFDLQRHLQVLRLAKEAEAIDECCQAIAGH